MELDELRALWKKHDQKLVESGGVDEKMLKNASVAKTSSLLWEYRFEAWVELVFESLLMIWLVQFALDQLFNLEYLAPTLVLIILSLISGYMNIMTLKMLREIDYNIPIATIQKSIESLKLNALRERYFTVIIIPIVFICGAIVVIKALFDFNIYYLFSREVLIYVFINSAFASGLVWLMLKFSNTGIDKVLKFLEEIKAFEKEDSEVA